MHPSVAGSITTFSQEVHGNARDKGWYEAPQPSVPELLVLIHSEVSEALEAYRTHHMRTTHRLDGKPEGFPSELADIVLRVFDLAANLDIDLGREIAIKHEYNLTRSRRHGNKAL